MTKTLKPIPQVNKPVNKPAEKKPDQQPPISAGLHTFIEAAHNVADTNLIRASGRAIASKMVPNAERGCVVGFVAIRTGFNPFHVDELIKKVEQEYLVELAQAKKGTKGQ